LLDEKTSSEMLPHLSLAIAELRDATSANAAQYPSDAELLDYAFHRIFNQTRRFEIKQHVDTCRACQAKLARLESARSSTLRWSEEELGRSHLEFIEAIKPKVREPVAAVVVFMANAWHWLGGELRPPARLLPEDFELRRKLGEWLLLKETTTAVAFAGEGTLSSLELAVDLAPDLRIGLVVTPEYIASIYRHMWRLRFELPVEKSSGHVEIDLLDQDGHSCGVRVIRSGKPAEYHVDPPTGRGYSVRVTWRGAHGKEPEREMDLPLRADTAST
jgi:hypothetical protein